MDQDATWYEGKPRPGDIVLDGGPSSPKRGTVLTFQPMSVVAKCGWMDGWMDPDVTWYEVGLGPGHIVLDGDPAAAKGTAPNFRPMSIVAKRSPISVTAEHLYNINRHNK